MFRNIIRSSHRVAARRVAVIALLASACDTGDRHTPDDFRGILFPAPRDKVDFTLPATTGEPFAFRTRTDGYVTLLFFGYTYCPDVCPIHMANIAAVLHKLPPQVAARIKVVMVTTDPERDSPERLRAWLDGFDPSFIGLRGSLEEVNAVQRSLRLPPAVRLDQDTENYTVGHASQVIAFTTDNRAHLVYPFGTRQADWAHDLPLLVDLRW